MLSADNMKLGFRRAKTDVRRQQIVEATLALLADSPIDQLSTRQIARELGVSQPALFRHFASRDALLLAVIAATRDRLREVVEAVLGRESGPLAALEALAVGLLRHLEANPGLPRLLFANVASGEGPVFEALKQLYAAQGAFVTDLVREAQRRGELDPRVDPRDAATLFVGLLQSVTLIRRLDPRSEPLHAEGLRLFGIWLDGTRARGSVAVAEKASVSDGLRALDVRPLLGKGIDPLETILDALGGIGPGGVLKLTTPFRPDPLLALLRGRGHAVSEARVGEREHALEVIVGGRPEPEDLRDLEPPEPLERVLSAVSRLGSGEVYLARLPRTPRLLFPRLAERGIEWAVHEERDGTALLRVFRPR